MIISQLRGVEFTIDSQGNVLPANALKAHSTLGELAFELGYADSDLYLTSFLTEVYAFKLKAFKALLAKLT